MNSSNGDETVWSFPYGNVYNILTSRYDFENPSPLVFYDVCSDAQAERELKWLKEEPPTFVVWIDIPGCLETHEAVFRNGERLGQRDIVEWFSDGIGNRYVLVGRVDNVKLYIEDETLRRNLEAAHRYDALSYLDGFGQNQQRIRGCIRNALCSLGL